MIVFSPTGNTYKVSSMIEKRLLERNIDVQLIDVTRDKRLFKKQGYKQYFRETVKEHDLLCIGSPVYAHHLHYNVHNIIKALPPAKNGWGQLAVPFVTYGGINSGVALQEAAKLLKKTGRIVVAGLKINAMHCLTRLKQVTTKINEGRPGEEAIPLIEELVSQIITFENKSVGECEDITSKLKYQKFKDRMKAKIIFREKLWQNHIYPKITIDHDKCKKCGKCAKVCPVQRIEIAEKGPIVPKGNPNCIHCVSCIIACPNEAIRINANWEKWNKLLKKASEGRSPISSKEHPKSVVFTNSKK